jgi:hypothetical protein
LAATIVDQSTAPSEFAYGGYSWDTLGTVNITGGSLIVTLGAGTNSSKYTVADAIRIEKTDGGGGGTTTGQISGTVWNDANGDGVYDGSESPLESWFIFLDQNQSGTLDASETAVQTSNDGGYLFEDLPDGTYYVTEILPSGWEQTTPTPTGGRGSSVPLSTVQIIGGESLTFGLEADRSPIDFTEIVSQSFVGEGSGDFSPSSIQSASLMNADDFRADPLFTGFNGSGFATVIIDSGADLDHPFYADQLVYSYDFSGTNDSDASDFDGHGTNVAGIAVSSDSTYTGTAPGSDLIVLKVFTDAGGGSFADVEEALQWVVSNASTYNIAAINMSLGDGGTYNSPFSAESLSDEMASLVAMDVMVISAAGNEYTTAGTEGISYPAADISSLAVSAVWDANNGGPWNWSGGTTDNTTAADRVTSFSSRSSTLTDIFAPGAHISNAGLSGGVSSYSGTSQAAPQVAGIATVAQQLATSTLGRRLTQAEFRSLMLSTGVTINDGDDEDDNVTNTGADYSRIDMWALMKGILATAASGNGVHNTTLSGGSTASGLNFGNRVTGSREANASEAAVATSLSNTAEQTVDSFSNTSARGRTHKTAASDSLQADAHQQQPRTAAGHLVAKTLIGNQQLARLVDTMFADDAASSLPPIAAGLGQGEAGGNSAQVIDNLLAATTDTTWERGEVSQDDDQDASLWLVDEPLNKFFV